MDNGQPDGNLNRLLDELRDGRAYRPAPQKMGLVLWKQPAVVGSVGTIDRTGWKLCGDDG